MQYQTRQNMETEKTQTLNNFLKTIRVNKKIQTPLACISFWGGFLFICGAAEASSFWGCVFSFLFMFVGLWISGVYDEENGERN